MDARELREVIAGLATAGPAEEDEGYRFGGPAARPPEKRLHLARQIASLWDESDAVTRTVLLAAFAIQNAWMFTEPSHAGLGRRFEAELRRAASLRPDQRAEALAAAEAMSGALPPDGGSEPERVAAVMRILRRALGGG